MAATIQSRGQFDAYFMIFVRHEIGFPNIASVYLFHYGNNGSVLIWFSDYLRNTFLSVLVHGSHSSWKNLSTGVPQGPVLDTSSFPFNEIA